MQQPPSRGQAESAMPPPPTLCGALLSIQTQRGRLYTLASDLCDIADRLGGPVVSDTGDKLPGNPGSDIVSGAVTEAHLLLVIADSFDRTIERLKRTL